MLYNSTCPMTVAYDTETTERNYRTYLKSRFCFSLSVSSAISTGMLKPQNFATKMSKIIIRTTVSALDHVLDHTGSCRNWLPCASDLHARPHFGKMERILSLCGLSLTKHATLPTRLPSDRLPIVCTCSPVRRPRKDVH